MIRRLLVVVACGLALAARPAAGQASAVAVGGDVPKPYVMTARIFAAIEPQEIAADNGDGMHWYHAVPLCGVLERAGVVFGDALKGTVMAAYVLVEGADGYRVVLPLASLDDAFGGGIFLADAVDGEPLTGNGPYRLVIPADTRLTRWVRQVVKVTVQVPPSTPP